jgi:hypothetical protein
MRASPCRLILQLRTLLVLATASLTSATAFADELAEQACARDPGVLNRHSEVTALNFVFTGRSPCAENACRVRVEDTKTKRTVFEIKVLYDDVEYCVSQPALRPAPPSAEGYTYPHCHGPEIEVNFQIRLARHFTLREIGGHKIYPYVHLSFIEIQRPPVAPDRELCFSPSTVDGDNIVYLQGFLFGLSPTRAILADEANSATLVRRNGPAIEPPGTR